MPLLPLNNPTGWYCLKDDVAFVKKSNLQGDAYFNFLIDQDDEQNLSIARDEGPKDPNQHQSSVKFTPIAERDIQLECQINTITN